MRESEMRDGSSRSKREEEWQLTTVFGERERKMKIEDHRTENGEYRGKRPV